MKKCFVAIGWVMGWLLFAAAGPLSAQELFRLVSAQVVTSTDRPPALKIAANGPIAFKVVTAEEGGQPAAPNQITVRLYGVQPGELASSGLAPFSVSVTAAENDSILKVSTADNVKLAVGPVARSNELTVVATVE